MPQFGAIGFSTPNSNNASKTPSTAVGASQILPSPSIWGSCDAQSLRDNPDGFFFEHDWKWSPSLPDMPSQNGTYTYAASTDSALNIAVTSTANAAIFTKPTVSLAPNGATKHWFEVSLNVQQSTAQQMFLGLATSTGLSSTLLTSSTAMTSTAGLIGFYMHADAPTQFDAVYRSSTGALVTVLANVLTAGSNNSDPGNPLFVPSVPPGALTGAQGFIKLGVRVDKTNAYWYVNGTLVAKQALDSTFDTVDSYGSVVTAGTGTANTDNDSISFYRVASRIS